MFCMVVVHTTMVMGRECVFETLTDVLWFVGDLRQQDEGRLLQPLQQCMNCKQAGGSYMHPVVTLHSPLCRPGPESAHGPGPRQTGREPLPAKQTCSLHIHIIKTNVFLKFLLASCCLFLVGLTVRTEVNRPVSWWYSE